MDAWHTDGLLAGFEARRLTFAPDYDGPVVATLVRRPGPQQTKAVLYVHGFIDYFFQAHMADRFLAEGFAFYALDLRKHGRSLLQGQHPCYCEHIAEYFPEITRAIDVILEDASVASLLLAGHSTGGLVCSLYAHEGEHHARIAALWLNSPFLEFSGPLGAQTTSAIAAVIGHFAPFASDPTPVSPFYPMSLHKTYYGEWEFDLRLKPIKGFPAYFGWVKAMRDAQAKVHSGLAISCPILSMHSDKSDRGTQWKDSFRTSDIVLDVADIERWSPSLGRSVTVSAIKDGLHDLVLSRKDVRESVFRTLFSWLRNSTAM
jgi:alpha-beta hydrolase superfamily lysophospholipase